MSVAAKVTNRIPLLQIVHDIVTRSINKGSPPSEIVTPEFVGKLDGELLLTFARTGLISDANDLLHRSRSGAQGEEPEKGRRPPHALGGRNPFGLKGCALDTIVHVGADGMLKPLRNFTAEDARKLLRDSESQRDAWLRRKKWATSLIRALGDNDAAVLGDLPKDEISGLSESAERAWA